MTLLYAMQAKVNFTTLCQHKHEFLWYELYVKTNQNINNTMSKMIKCMPFKIGMYDDKKDK